MTTTTDLKEPELQVVPLRPVTPLQPTPRLQPVTPTHLQPPPKDYLFLSILAILFFFPLAILALVFSLKTREANFFENRELARRNSKLALAFSILSMLMGSVVTVLSVVLRVWRLKM